MPSRTAASEGTRRSTRSRGAGSKSAETVMASDNSSDEEMRDVNEDEESESASEGEAVATRRTRRRKSSTAESSVSSTKSAAKRKRAAAEVEADEIEEDGSEEEDENEDPEEEIDEDEEEEEEEEEEEDFQPPRRGRGRPPKNASTKPAATKNSRKKARVSTARPGSPNSGDENALFEAIKDPNTAVGETAYDWVQSYETNKVEALKEIVNFILRCCGCDASITAYDIEDQDSATQTLAQIQEVFGKKPVADYPLSSKKPEFKKFRSSLVKFFGELVEKSADREVLYEDDSLMESLQIWIAAMSSSTLRSFRHTSTTIGLSMLSRLCSIAASIAKTTGNSAKLLEREKAKPKPAKAKLDKLQATVDEYAQKNEVIDGLIRDMFATIFVHRYRDIDPKIRTECMRELGKWMETFPDVFFEGQYLRYMGWMLSDANGGTRHEVIRNLTKLYKDNYYIGGLRQFTERFRPRLVEIATHDVEHSVRIAAIELLDVIRAVGFLEQEDIDEVCGLLFDINPRVRKAVVPFFLSNVKEVVSERLASIGDIKKIRAYLAGELESDIEEEDEEDEEEEEKPSGAREIQKSWFSLKVIVETLQSYSESENVGDPLSVSKWETLINGKSESRLSVASRSLWESLNSLPEWTEVIKYALFDTSVRETDDDDSIGTKIKRELALSSAQEYVVLEMAIGAVQAALASAPTAATAATAEKRRGRRMNVEEKENSVKKISDELVPMISRILKKFSADPDSAGDIMRLHNCIDLQSYQVMRQKQVYEDTFSEFCKLFMTFDSSSLVREFIGTIINGQKNEYLSDTVESRTRDLLDELCDGFRSAMKIYGDLATDSIRDEDWPVIAKVLGRLMHLAAAVNVTEALQYKPREADKTMLDLLIALAQRGDKVESTQETEVVMAAVSTLRYFVLWKTQHAMLMHSPVSLRDFETVYDDIVSVYERIILSDAPQELCQSTVLCLVDILSAVSVMLRKEGFSVALETRMSNVAQKATMKMFLAREKALARVAKVKLQKSSVLQSLDKIMADAESAKVADGEQEQEDVSDLSEADSDPEPEADDENDDDSEAEADQADVTSKVSEKIETEIKLCEIGGRVVRGILTGSIDRKYARRIALNAKPLGPAFVKIVGELAPVLKM